ncbi:unnamed protein product, partial [Anisakis simplex]|uniref:Acetoacetyl-CoA synthetase (inferred by orthology to a C. elegans protein) n=1 Tax=Anisakis simplex TaxID=6269 RepID=A0A0M3KJ35_ANISI
SETVCKYYTYDRLRSDVKRLAIALRDEGITKGDRIVGFLTNSYETAVAMLATTAIGAVWSSASVDFGTLGVLDRFQQLNPVVLFSAVRTTYKGKEFNLENKITEIIKGSTLKYLAL